MTLITWSWIFLVLYIGAMIGIGLFAQRKIQHADDFATARGGYGPFFLLWLCRLYGKRCYLSRQSGTVL